MEVVLLKPFVYSHRPTAGQRLTTETKFVPKRDEHTKAWLPTEVSIPDHIWDDPWVSEQYADGHIERPEVTAARMRSLEDKHQKEAEANARVAAQAEAAFRRMQGAASIKQARENTVSDDLNTPINELGVRRGADLDTKTPTGEAIDQKKLEEELNTPVSVLQARQLEDVKDPEQPANGGRKNRSGRRPE